MIPQFLSLTFSTVSKLGDYYLVLFLGDLLSYLKGTLALDPAQASWITLIGTFSMSKSLSLNVDLELLLKLLAFLTFKDLYWTSYCSTSQYPRGWWFRCSSRRWSRPGWNASRSRRCRRAARRARWGFEGSAAGGKKNIWRSLGGKVCDRRPSPRRQSCRSLNFWLEGLRSVDSRYISAQQGTWTPQSSRSTVS